MEVTRLLHFGEFEVEQVVDPVEELRASHEERGMLEPDGRRVRRSHRRDLDSGGDGARWFAVRACDAGFGVVDDDARAVFASRDGGGAPVVVLGLARGVLEGARGASLSSRCQPRPLVPPSREKKSLNSTLSCRDCDERDLFCSVAKNAPLQKMQIRRIQGQSKPPLGRTRTRMTSAKTWCLTVGSPARAGPFSEPCATARARWTPPKATRPATRSRPHRAVPTSQRHGYQAEDVRLHSLDSNRVSGFNSWPLGLILPGFTYPPRSSAGSSGPRPGLSDSLESASSSRCHVSPPSVPRSRLPRSTRAVRSRAVRPER